MQDAHVSPRRIAALFAGYRGRLAALGALIVVQAAAGVASPFLLREIVDRALPDKDTTLLTLLAAGMAVAGLAAAALGVATSRLSNVIGQGVMHDVRTRLYAHVQRMSLAFFTRTRTGELQSRIANDVAAIDGVVTSSVGTVVQGVVTVLAVLVSLFVLDWQLALVSVAIVPALAALNRSVGRAQRRLARERQSRVADMTSLIGESLSVSGHLLARTTGSGPLLLDRFGTQSRAIADLEITAAMTGRWRQAIVGTAFTIMPAIVYWLGGLTLAAGWNAVSIGTLVAFTSMQNRLVSPVAQLLGVWLRLSGSLGLFERIFGALDEPVDLPDGARTAPARRGELVLDDVWFRYGDAWTLEGVALHAEPGQRIALVGETGAGKTTLGYLITRLYEAERGAVRIDGVDVRELSQPALVASVGHVAQATHLFHASVAENLRLAKPGATDAELHGAARAAQIHDLLCSLPDGYDTLVGERGYRFSGGEQQRLSIARALLRDPPVLVLDEATSALDTETEQRVAAALATLTEGRTTVTIAHRLLTVQAADEILVLDGGRVAERGTHAELLARDGRYAALTAPGLPLGVVAPTRP